MYYRDFTFDRESYIGILYYDDSTYALRYYAPALAEKKSLEPEKNIHILFTINPENQDFERTGERILSAITPDDTFLVNYVEGFFDEMTKHRQDEGIIESKTQDYQDYAQFGGKVMQTFQVLRSKVQLPLCCSIQHGSIPNDKFSKVARIWQEFSQEERKWMAILQKL